MNIYFHFSFRPSGGTSTYYGYYVLYVTYIYFIPSNFHISLLHFYKFSYNDIFYSSLEQYTKLTYKANILCLFIFILCLIVQLICDTFPVWMLNETKLKQTLFLILSHGTRGSVSIT